MPFQSEFKRICGTNNHHPQISQITQNGKEQLVNREL